LNEKETEAEGKRTDGLRQWIIIEFCACVVS
jgi:hypothetical protein